jgi:hypothetical protein
LSFVFWGFAEILLEVEPARLDDDESGWCTLG